MKTGATSKRQGVFTQISLFSVLLDGRYGGVCSIADVKKHGNLAIATMDRLDGEMQMIDGVVYQACADGRLLLPDDKETIPFGTIARFTPEQELDLEAIPCFEAFEERMKTECPGLNLPMAVHVTGDFQRMKVRAVVRQEKDGVGLAEAARHEAVFELSEISGDMVGFRLPGYVQGVNAPGWHLHFVDAARRQGGHVVNFSLKQGVMRICWAREFQIVLPDVLDELDLDRDWSDDLRRAEAER